MRSFVLWYTKRESKIKDDEKAKLDLHINLWKVQKNFLKEKFIFDFGFFINDITKIKNIYFYIPFEVEEIKDLGENILNNHKLVGAIFNEVCDICTTRVGKRIKINMKDEEFMIYSLSDDQKKINSCHDNHGGCILSLQLDNILSENEKELNQDIEKIKKYYFRFRIKTDKKNLRFIRNHDFDQSVFSNVFTRTEIIDFRINDIRTCSEMIKEKYGSNYNFNIRKINYLLLRNFNDEFIYYDGNVKSRILENDLWDDYIEEIHEDLIAYHIKKTAENDKKTNEKVTENNQKNDQGIDSFVNLTRFRYKKTNLKILVIYLLIFIFSSISIGVLSSLILEKMKNLLLRNFKLSCFSFFIFPFFIFSIGEIITNFFPLINIYKKRKK